MKFPATITDGKLQSDSEAIKAWVRGKRDGKYVIDIDKDVRSTSDNAYYWGVVVKMFSDRLIELGNQEAIPVNTHELLKQKFNPAIIIINDEENRVGKTTTKLNEEEFYDYCQRIKIYANEVLEIIIPDKGECL